eukprot:gene29893-17970_t
MANQPTPTPTNVKKSTKMANIKKGDIATSSSTTTPPVTIPVTIPETTAETITTTETGRRRYYQDPAKEYVRICKVHSASISSGRKKKASPSSTVPRKVALGSMSESMAQSWVEGETFPNGTRSRPSRSAEPDCPHETDETDRNMERSSSNLIDNKVTGTGTITSYAARTLTNKWIGRSNWSSDFYACLDVREMAFYDRSLTDSELSDVVGHLHDKYFSGPGFARSPFAIFIWMHPNCHSFLLIKTNVSSWNSFATAEVGGAGLPKLRTQ